MIKSIIKPSAVLLLGALWLTGCNPTSHSSNLFQYKDAYVGDASAVGNILDRLPIDGYPKDFALKTQNPPFGIVLNYSNFKSPAAQKEVILYSATYLFTLIQNVDWVSYNFDNQEYKITKKDLQNWYGKDFNDLKSEDELNAMIKTQLNDPNKMNILFTESGAKNLKK